MKLTKNIAAFIFISILMIPSFSSAQSAFMKGDNVLNLGIGVAGHYGVYSGYTSQSPSIGISYDHGMDWQAGDGAISLGGYFGYKSLSAKDAFINYTWTYIIIGMRGAYHYNLFDNEKLDAYGVVMFSYDIVSFDNKTVAYPGYIYYTGGSASGLGFSISIGSRYEFSDQWGAFAELGYGIAYFTVGGSMKF